MNITTSNEGNKIVYTIGNETNDKIVTVEEEQQDKNIIYKITGRIDTQTAPALQSIIIKHTSTNNIVLVLDLSGVEYLSSAGLRVILYIQTKLNMLENAAMKIINVQPDVMEIFDITGCLELLSIE